MHSLMNFSQQQKNYLLAREPKPISERGGKSHNCWIGRVSHQHAMNQPKKYKEDSKSS
jgi:hypothetical protein